MSNFKDNNTNNGQTKSKETRTITENNKISEEQKNLNTRRIWIYILISFGLVWAVMIPYGIVHKSFNSYSGQFILACAMLCPTIATIITRIITKEGCNITGNNSLKLGIDLKNKKWIYYIAALLLPLVYYELGYVIYFLLAPDAYNPDNIEAMGLTKGIIPIYVLYGIVISTINSFGGLGEEIGWRTYLYPKLEEKFGLKKAVILGGIIWSVWHFPGIVAGHNFGHDYILEPWSGFLVFTISCVSIGIVLYYITIKTNSIWPAAILHATNNGNIGYLRMCVSEQNVNGILSDAAVGTAIITIPLVIISIILICKRKFK